MHFLKTIVVLLFASFVAGCGNLNGFKTLMPERFDMSAISPQLYIEAGANQATRDTVQQAMSTAENAIIQTYGSVSSRPIFNICISEACYKALGGSPGTLGGNFVFLNRVLLSPKGMNWHFIAHEWSHAELFSRLTLAAWWRNPVWFDEGLAVAVSDAPQHSKNHWDFLSKNNTPRPTREALLSIKTLKEWNLAIHQFGEDRNREREAKGEPAINPVYAAAGQEIRPWLARVGGAGLLELIARLNSGETFELVYPK